MPRRVIWILATIFLTALVILGFSGFSDAAAKKPYQPKYPGMSIPLSKINRDLGITTTTTTTSTTIAKLKPAPARRKVITQTPQSPPAAIISDQDAKAYVYGHEGAKGPCEIFGGKVDCNYKGHAPCGLGQANPCDKLRAVCSLNDYACEDAWFTQYAIARYGSWQGAYHFRASHNFW